MKVLEEPMPAQVMPQLLDKEYLNSFITATNATKPEHDTNAAIKLSRDLVDEGVSPRNALNVQGNVPSEYPLSGAAQTAENLINATAEAVGEQKLKESPLEKRLKFEESLSANKEGFRTDPYKAMIKKAMELSNQGFIEIDGKAVPLHDEVIQHALSSVPNNFWLMLSL
ncbi:hypothetical protein HMPREF3144_06725 [Oligella sp. HMSC05A10]|uniref:hypothetical protein n=1 Tax=Oligella sp. HMSC05A10 TaxID=1581112 RepID=UPI0008A60B6C|nr:hypothetical protein [Oligella sp. HMSC05A10]OFS84387.1 hypothetical protein HMPREF3144_06725 [Oligella sp. HMSC05A10]